MAGMHLPPRVFYPFVKLGARLFGHFDLEETTAAEAMKSCRLPVFFIHGEDDRFVPCDMSRRNYEACAAPKRPITVPGAGSSALSATAASTCCAVSGLEAWIT